jgi:rhamnose transport system permease protein
MRRREISLLAVVAVLGLLPLLGVPGFYRLANLRNLALDNLPALVAAVGMTAVIICGEIDISIGSLFVVCGALSGLAAKAGWPMPFAIAGTLAAGAAAGAVNGLLVSRVRVPSIIATLAMMAILRNGIIRATGGAWIQDLPAGFQWFGAAQAVAQPCYILAGVLILVAAAAALRWTAAGRSLYAVGCDHEAARRIGLSPPRVVVAAFVAMGLLVATAALLNFTRYPTIETNAGIGFELQVIAAVVVGGASVTGGRGTVLGTLLGVILLGMMGTVLTFLHVNPAWGRAVQGAIILVSVLADSDFGRRRSHA